MNGDSSPTSSNRRRTALAVVLALIAPGLGHLYAGQPRQAAAWLVARLSIPWFVAVVIWWWGINVTVLFVVTTQAWVITIACAASAAVVARAAPDSYQLRRYNRALVYLAFWAGFTLLASGTSHLLRTHVIEAFKLPSGSMIPTLEVGDHVFADKTIHGAEAATPGNVIVFRFPVDLARAYTADSNARCIDPSVLHEPTRKLSRIVAVGGEEIERRDHALFINGRKVASTELSTKDTGNSAFPYETTLRETLPNAAGHQIRRIGGEPDFGPVQIPEGHIFVLGDNRGNSSDSSCWGFVPIENIEGVVTHVWWSSAESGVRWDRIGLEVD